MPKNQIKQRAVSLMEMLAALAVWSMTCIVLAQWMSFSLARDRHAFAQRRAAMLARDIFAATDALPWESLTSERLAAMALAARADLSSDDDWQVTALVEELPAESEELKRLQSRRISVTIGRAEFPPVKLSFATLRQHLAEEKLP